MLVNTKKGLAFGFLLVFILCSVSGFITLVYAETPPAGTKVTILEWTYFEQSTHTANAYFNLHLQWKNAEGETVDEWVPAFCLDSGIYWAPTPDRMVVASDDPNLPSYIADENLKIINYIMYKWHENTWPEAGWEEVQWAIWHYSDASMGTGGQYPDYDEDVYDEIILHVDNNKNYIENTWNGPYTVMVLDPGDGIDDQRNVQLTFFEIPEVAFGTITSLIAMAGGFLYRKKHT